MSHERASVQGDGSYWLQAGDVRRAKANSPGTIAWEEHLEVYAVYSKKYGTQQSAERLAARGGFGKLEAESLLGHPLRTWEPR